MPNYRIESTNWRPFYSNKMSSSNSMKKKSQRERLTRLGLTSSSREFKKLKIVTETLLKKRIFKLRIFIDSSILKSKDYETYKT